MIHAIETLTEYSPATRMLIRAVKEDRVKMAQKAIHLGANVNVRVGDNNDNLLHICLSENMGAVLINHGTNVDARNNQQETPLHTAMRRDIPSLALLLIANKSDPNAQDINGYAPLHLAESTEVNAALLDQKANVDVQNVNGDTPLLLAIRLKGSPMVDALVNAGADKYITNVAGNNAYNELAALIARREAELEKVAKSVLLCPCESQSYTTEPCFRTPPPVTTLPAFEIAKARDTTTVPEAAAENEETNAAKRPRLTA